MKKLLTSVSLVLLAVAMVCTLVSCGDKSEAVKEAFEEAGYTVSSVKGTDTIAKAAFAVVGMTDDQMKDAGEYEVMVVNKGLVPAAVVIKFPGSGDVKDFLTYENASGDKDSSAYDTAKEKGTINGNCLIFTLSSDALNTFKEA